MAHDTIHAVAKRSEQDRISWAFITDIAPELEYKRHGKAELVKHDVLSTGDISLFARTKIQYCIHLVPRIFTIVDGRLLPRNRTDPLRSSVFSIDDATYIKVDSCLRTFPSPALIFHHQH